MTLQKPKKYIYSLHCKLTSSIYLTIKRTDLNFKGNNKSYNIIQWVPITYTWAIGPASSSLCLPCPKVAPHTITMATWVVPKTCRSFTVEGTVFLCPTTKTTLPAATSSWSENWHSLFFCLFSELSLGFMSRSRGIWYFDARVLSPSVFLSWILFLFGVERKR